jgi:solute carrier family 25 oxoglutarate transporter 11
MAATSMKDHPGSRVIKLSPTTLSFVTSGLGGCSAWLLIHPVNTVCIRMNLAQTSGGSSLGVVGMLSSMVRERGFLSLYNGLEAGLLRQVVYTTSRLGLFEHFRDELAKVRGHTDIWSRLASATVAGGIAAFISCPVEVTLVRMSNDSALPADKRRNYRGVADAFARILREEGVRTMFSGAVPLVQRACVTGAFQVGTYDQFRDTFRKWGITNQFTNVFWASMASGLLFAGATMPLETAKNRMAFQKPDPVTGVLPYRGTSQAILSIAREGGFVNGLYAGFFPYYIRCGGMTLLTFMSVEYLRTIYKRWE